jgi:signal transduction histidine kinase
MIGAPGLLSLHQYLYIFIIAVVILAILGIFIGNLYKRLSIRIIALIFVSGPATVIITRVLNDLFLRARLPFYFHLLETVLIVLCGPVILGLLAAGFIRRPLRQFNKAVASLEQSNYKVQLRSTGIHEFDEVFTRFNDLIKRLQHEEKLRKDLVSDTSHELNTPLTTMIGQLTAMQEGKHAANEERIAILKEQAERLSELVQQLDAYTKARMPVTSEPENINLRQICEELTKRFSLELEQKGIAPKLDIAEDCILHANRNALQQILTNLMQNTLRYSKATELTITATARVLTFSDNGKGVPSDSLPYLFERFYRVDKSRNRTTGGLGLGLAIVRELTEQQGWHIHAEPAHPGISFVLTLR